MKYLLLALALGVPTWGLLTRVHDRNKAVAAGAAAYGRGEPVAATAAFAAALAANAQRQPDPHLLLNLAHAQSRAGQQSRAQVTYGRLLTKSPAALSSVARQQLAVLATRRGEIAQALTLLRQALLLDPKNSGARFDYEALSEYLTRRASGPKIAPPKSPAPDSAAKPNAPNQPKAADKAGNDRPGKINDPNPATAAPNTPLEPRPGPAGSPDNRLPDATPGNAAAGGQRTNAGKPQPVASGATPGAQRGLDRRSAAPVPGTNGPSNRPGTDAATASDAQLQTQRERLAAMSLSPAQARQLLETLRAQEQQYLQQLTRPARQKPDPSKPTW
ncbi:hypothetical protein [Hymenobacter sp.]|uniref:hypothetical protein n=1 Tax=Hymenobacter sp. TaxID=1898978 RepID=UPI00286BEE5F|nr:hypothetical protein [Hymenobacter sp.]